MQKAGVPITSVRFVLSGAELAEALDRVLSDGHELFVVGGGDGTVSCAAGRIAGADVTLGVLPLGTANDLARTLEIPKSSRGMRCSRRREGGRHRHRPGKRAAVPQRRLRWPVRTEALSLRLKRRIVSLAYGFATLRAYGRHHSRASCSANSAERAAKRSVQTLRPHRAGRCPAPCWLICGPPRSSAEWCR
jgi:diacylglycerol kinase (ATP)